MRGSRRAEIKAGEMLLENEKKQGRCRESWNRPSEDRKFLPAMGNFNR